MPYDIKLVKNGVVVGVYPVTHLEATPFPSRESPVREHRDPETGLALFADDDIGIEVECCGCLEDPTDPDESPNVHIRIPRDGDAIYVSETRDGVAHTIHSYRVDPEGNILAGFSKNEHANRPATPTRGGFGRTTIGQ